MTFWYDTHAHLDHAAFARDRSEVLDRARAAGVERIISVGVDFESSRRAIELAESCPEVYAAVGWHPSHAAEAPDDLRPELRALAQHPKVVALGETGLDYYHLPSRKGGDPADDEPLRLKQDDLFRQHLEVAEELGLNCVVHERDSWDAVLEVFTPFAAKVRAQFHCFCGTPEAMRHALGLGSLVSFTGILTHADPRGDLMRATLRETPLDGFMLETDSPYLAPAPHRRSSRCEPALVRETALRAAEVKGVTPEELSVATRATAEAFFPRLAPQNRGAGLA